MPDRKLPSSALIPYPPGKNQVACKWKVFAECSQCKQDAAISHIAGGSAFVLCESCGWSRDLETPYNEVIAHILEDACSRLKMQS